jgi:hypothetical protein
MPPRCLSRRTFLRDLQYEDEGDASPSASIGWCRPPNSSVSLGMTPRACSNTRRCLIDRRARYSWVATTNFQSRAPEPSTGDLRRRMGRGANHSIREATRDSIRVQKVQVGRQEASAIMRSTGLRRRERSFKSCRGHHALPACIAQRHRYEQALARSCGMVRGTNSFHEPLHASRSAARSELADAR